MVTPFPVIVTRLAGNLDRNKQKEKDYAFMSITVNAGKASIIYSNCSPYSKHLTVPMPIYVLLGLTALYASIAPGDMYKAIT